jgi:hypothetical protein
MAEQIGSTVVEGTLYWTYLTRKQNEKYTVDVANFSDEDREKLKSLAFEAGRTKNKFIKEKDGHPSGGEYITLSSQYPIERLYWPSGKQLSEDELNNLGEGTRVSVRVGAFTTHSQKYGLNIGAGLQIAKVINYVKYTPAENPADGMGFEGELVNNDTPPGFDDLDDDIPFGNEAV